MKAKILVVDDEPTVRESLEEILRLEGYSVVSVENGDLAVNALQSEGFDLILLDLKMPGLDGIDVMRLATKISPDTKIILLTGHGSIESAVEALRHSAHDYLIKPIPTHELLSSVGRAIAQRTELQKKRMLLEQLDISLQRLKDAERVQSASLNDQQIVSLGNGTLVDLSRREVWRGDQRVGLTPTEGKLLRVLLQNRGRVLAHRDLVLLVQGYETTEWEAPEVLRPLISRLRRKLSAIPNGENWITNVRGTGYVFEVPAGSGETNQKKAD
jgi:DNA-binding response OmpR family regulator